VRAGGAPRGNAPARASGPAQDYNSGQFQASPGYPPAQDYNTGQSFGAPQDYNTGQFQPDPGYPPAPPAQDYNTGQSFGAPQDYNTGQFQPDPGYPQAQGFDRGQGNAPAPRSQPGRGYPQAGGYPPGQGPQPRGPQGGRGDRRLYAVPASPTPGAEGMGPGGRGQMGQYATGQMAQYSTGQMPQYATGQMPQYATGQMPQYATGQMPQYGGGQAVALAGPAWQDPAAWQGETQGVLATMPAPAFAPPRPRTRPNGPAVRPARPRTAPARSARPNSLAGPRTAPARRQEGARGRQARAMRIATAATVSLFSFAVIAAGANIAHFGFKFFTFREAGAGETGGSEFDTNFLAQQAAAAKAAAQAHTPGKHSAKTTSG
jgi:hypothetical protein